MQYIPANHSMRIRCNTHLHTWRPMISVQLLAKLEYSSYSHLEETQPTKEEKPMDCLSIPGVFPWVFHWFLRF